MSPVETVTKYLQRMAWRLRLYTGIRGIIIALVVSTGVTTALALALTRMAPSPAALRTFRAFLFLCTGATAIAAIAIPLARLSAMAVARKVESRFPHFKQRLITLTERRQDCPSDRFLPLLAHDTIGIALEAKPSDLITRATALNMTLMGAAPSLFALWLILWSSGPLANQARSLWTGRNDFRVELKPAGKTVLRGSAVSLSAHLSGFAAKEANLFVRYSKSAIWKQISLPSGPDETTFVFELESLPDNAEFYAESEGIRSSVSLIKTVELPRVQRITVSYVGRVETPSQSPQEGAKTNGDIIAPAGTRATLNIETDRPLATGELIIEPGDSVDLAATEKNRTSVGLTVLRHGWYHVSARFGNDMVKISDDHEISVPVADSTRPHPTSPIIVRTGPIPAGYERAVAEYYKRISELKVLSPAK